jgi:hypothetical protein
VSGRGWTDDKALRVYMDRHWGLSARGIYTRRAPDPTLGTASAMGELVAIVYRTQKAGDPGPTDYEHVFGPDEKATLRGSSKGLAVLAFNPSGLLILGGDYKVDSRGIVG